MKIKFHLFPLFFFCIGVFSCSNRENNRIRATEKCSEAVKIYYSAFFTHNSDSIKVALSIMDEVVALDSSYISGYLIKSKMLTEQDSLSESLKVLTRGLSSNPNNPDLFLVRGIVNDKLNNLDLAKIDYQQAICLFSKITDEEPHDFSALQGHILAIMLLQGNEAGRKELRRVENQLAASEEGKNHLKIISDILSSTKERFLENFK
jgi:tetratricopeptide (TPR) repeat protein